MATLRDKYNLTGSFFIDAVLLLEVYHEQMKLKKVRRRRVHKAIIRKREMG